MAENWTEVKVRNVVCAGEFRVEPSPGTRVTRNTVKTAMGKLLDVGQKPGDFPGYIYKCPAAQEDASDLSLQLFPRKSNKTTTPHRFNLLGSQTEEDVETNVKSTFGYLAKRANVGIDATDVRVTNVVATVDSDSKDMSVDLKALSSHPPRILTDVEYDPKRFQAVTGKLPNGTSTCIFRNGYVRFAGAQSLQQVQDDWAILAPKLVHYTERDDPMQE